MTVAQGPTMTQKQHCEWKSVEPVTKHWAGRKATFLNTVFCPGTKKHAWKSSFLILTERCADSWEKPRSLKSPLKATTDTTSDNSMRPKLHHQR